MDDGVLLVYTDGSAAPNPGRVAYAVVLESAAGCQVIANKTGIGSNITAELCGLRCALEAASRVQQDHHTVYIF